MKICTKCKENKDKSEFYPNRTTKDGLYTYCIPCRREYIKEFRKRPHIEKQQKEYLSRLDVKLRTKLRQSSEKGRISSRNSRYKNLFGISIDDYNQMLADQNSNCIICSKNQSELRYRLAIDHCHKTGKVRGLLCNNCNTAIGLFYDSDINLEKALNYIRKHK